jgi:DNA-binding MurR/RpiR family transcriptional regulator
VRTSVFDDAHMMLMSAALLSDGDVAIGFSHSGTTTAVIEPLELARKNGARIIGLTNYAGSPIASIADVVLCSTAQGSPLLGENAAARIAQLVVFDAVFAAVAQRDLAAAERNLAATMGAVTSKRRQT